MAQKRPIPTEIVIEMVKRGYNNVDIIRYLRQNNYTPVEINDAFNQAKIKLELSRTGESEIEQESPVLESGQEQIQQQDIPAPPVSQDILSKVRELSSRLDATEQKIATIASYLENLQKRLGTKFQESSTAMSTLSSQVSALQQSFSKVLEPLVHNVKAKSGMLNIDEGEESAEKTEEPEDDVEKVTVIKEKKITKKRSKPGLEEHVKKK
jgi:uncharacterized membrane-anchored protein YhcB (DUF1043 family)